MLFRSTGVVEVAHADLAEVPRMVVVGEHTVVVHASGVIAASGVLSIFSQYRSSLPLPSLPPPLEFYPPLFPLGLGFRQWSGTRRGARADGFITRTGKYC